MKNIIGVVQTVSLLLPNEELCPRLYSQDRIRRVKLIQKQIHKVKKTGPSFFLFFCGVG